MIVRSKSYFRTSRHHGLTLIEVVASLAILGSLLVAILQARGRSIQQWSAANRRIEAVAVADALLSQWWQKPEALPHQGTGQIAGDSRLAWRTRLMEEKSLEEFGLEKVRLEIMDQDAKEPNDPLVTVDLVLKHEELKKQ